MDTYPDTRQAIATAARTINHHHSLGETLQRIVESARESVPGFDEVGISALYKDGRIDAKALADLFAAHAAIALGTPRSASRSPRRSSPARSSAWPSAS